MDLKEILNKFKAKRDKLEIQLEECEGIIDSLSEKLNREQLLLKDY